MAGRTDVSSDNSIGEKFGFPVPGVEPSPTRAYVFFEDDGGDFRNQFRNLTCFADPPAAQKGGVNDVGCKISLPDGRLFHGIVYHGDLSGWRTDLTVGAQGLGLLLGQIEFDKFVLSDGSSVSLSDCDIKSA